MLFCLGNFYSELFQCKRDSLAIADKKKKKKKFELISYIIMIFTVTLNQLQ